MSLFLKAENKGELMLVFNIGSSFVGGEFFLAQKSGIPKIIFSVEEPIPIEGKIDINRLLFLTMQTLQTVVKKVHKARIGVPKRIFCVLSSPWYVSQTRTVNLEKNTSFIFTAKLADSLIKKEINLFKEEHLMEKTDIDNAFRIIEFKNIKTVLNGYETSKPLNQKVKELQMTIFVSIGGEQILRKIEETIKIYFHSSQITFSSSALASFTMVRDTYGEQENFLLIDIGGEVTDIFMVKKNALHESITFPLGLNFFIRGIASSFHCTLNEASSLFSLFRDGHAEEKLVKKLRPVLNQLKTKWLKQLEESLANFTKDISIPSTIYVATDKKMANFFSEIIKTEQFNQYSRTESKFKIISLNTKTLHGGAQFKENVIREPFLIINSIYINRFLIYPAKAGRVQFYA